MTTFLHSSGPRHRAGSLLPDSQLPAHLPRDDVPASHPHPTPLTWTLDVPGLEEASREEKQSHRAGSLSQVSPALAMCPLILLS